MSRSAKQQSNGQRSSSGSSSSKDRLGAGPPEGDEEADGAIRRRVRAFASSFLPAIVLFLWVRSFVVEPFYIPSLSMYPTLTINDQIAVEKFSKLVADPRRGDLVVFSPPKGFYVKKGISKAPRTTLIKRVVAVGGDRVEVDNGVLFINGRPEYEPYIREAIRYPLEPVVVPPGCIFVLGDNRNISDDSHVWGPLPVSNVIGKAFYVIWPIQRQGFVDEVMQDLEITGDPSGFFDRVSDYAGDLPAKVSKPRPPAQQESI